MRGSSPGGPSSSLTPARRSPAATTGVLASSDRGHSTCIHAPARLAPLLSPASTAAHTPTSCLPPVLPGLCSPPDPQKQAQRFPDRRHAPPAHPTTPTPPTPPPPPFPPLTPPLPLAPAPPPSLLLLAASSPLPSPSLLSLYSYPLRLSLSQATLPS